MKVNYETGFQIGVMEARLKKMRKQRDEYKKQRDELIGDIAKLRERNEELENMWRTLKNELFGRYEFYRFRLSELQIESRANKEVAIYRRAEINLSVILCRMDKLDGTNEFYEFLGKWRMTQMNNREQIEQSVISASAYNGNDTEGLLKEIEDVYKKAQAFDEIREAINAQWVEYPEDWASEVLREVRELEYEEEQENEN